MRFDPAFRFYSEDPQQREWWVVDGAALGAEARDERDQRRSYYPQRVLKGRMTEDEMKRELRVMAAIAYYFTFPHTAREQPRPPSTWAERVHALRREIALRRQFYPRWISTGRLTEPEAARKLALFETMHDAMWNEMTPEAIAGRDATEKQAKLARAA